MTTPTVGSPTDRLHRRFRFPQVLRYSLSCNSDSLATPIYVHRQCRASGYNQYGWFTRIFCQGSDKFQQLFISYIAFGASNMKILSRILAVAPKFITPINRGTSFGRELLSRVRQLTNFHRLKKLQMSSPAPWGSNDRTVPSF